MHRYIYIYIYSQSFLLLSPHIPSFIRGPCPQQSQEHVRRRSAKGRRQYFHLQILTPSKTSLPDHYIKWQPYPTISYLIHTFSPSPPRVECRGHEQWFLSAFFMLHPQHQSHIRHSIKCLLNTMNKWMNKNRNQRRLHEEDNIWCHP